MTVNNLSSVEQRANQLLSKLATGKALYDVVLQELQDKFLISGRPISYWENELKMFIPVDNLSPQLCKELDIEIMKRTQIASLYHAAASAKAQYIKRGTESNYHARLMAIVAEYKEGNKRVPAATTLESLAKIDTDDMETATALAEIETKFWKNILDHLSSCRKIIENVSLNISVELKSEQSAQYLERLNDKINNSRRNNYE